MARTGGNVERTAILAVVVALVLVAAGAYVVLTSGIATDNSISGPVDHDGASNGNDTDGQEVPAPGNNTVSVHFPVDLSPGDPKIALDLSYPGKGQEGTYNYSWNRSYELRLNSSVLSNFEGRVLTKVFANKSNQIGTHCLIITPNGGSPISWQLKDKNGINFISGDLGNWISNGTGGDSAAFTLLFNRTGDFNLTFQSFDLDTGEPLSAPLTVGPLRTPVAGSLSIDALGPGSYRTEGNGTYYTVLLNVTNGWNIRHGVDASCLVLSNGTAEVRANLSAMSFVNQSLATGQTTQFMAYFDITGDIDTFRLEYRGPDGGQAVDVPLG